MKRFILSILITIFAGIPLNVRLLEAGDHAHQEQVAQIFSQRFEACNSIKNHSRRIDALVEYAADLLDTDALSDHDRAVLFKMAHTELLGQINRAEDVSLFQFFQHLEDMAEDAGIAFEKSDRGPWWRRHAGKLAACVVGAVALGRGAWSNLPASQPEVHQQTLTLPSGAQAQVRRDNNGVWRSADGQPLMSRPTSGNAIMPLAADCPAKFASPLRCDHTSQADQKPDVKEKLRAQLQAALDYIKTNQRFRDDLKIIEQLEQIASSDKKSAWYSSNAVQVGGVVAAQLSGVAGLRTGLVCVNVCGNAARLLKLRSWWKKVRSSDLGLRKWLKASLGLTSKEPTDQEILIAAARHDIHILLDAHWENLKPLSVEARLLSWMGGSNELSVQCADPEIQKVCEYLKRYYCSKAPHVPHKSKDAASSPKQEAAQEGASAPQQHDVVASHQAPAAAQLALDDFDMEAVSDAQRDDALRAQAEENLQWQKGLLARREERQHQIQERRDRLTRENKARVALQQALIDNVDYLRLLQIEFETEFRGDYQWDAEDACSLERERLRNLPTTDDGAAILERAQDMLNACNDDNDEFTNQLIESLLEYEQVRQAYERSVEEVAGELSPEQQEDVERALHERAKLVKQFLRAALAKAHAVFSDYNGWWSLYVDRVVRKAVSDEEVPEQRNKFGRVIRYSYRVPILKVDQSRCPRKYKVTLDSCEFD